MLLYGEQKKLTMMDAITYAIVINPPDLANASGRVYVSNLYSLPSFKVLLVIMMAKNGSLPISGLAN